MSQKYNIDILLSITDNSDYPIELSGDENIHKIIQEDEQKMCQKITDLLEKISGGEAEFKELNDNKIFFTVNNTDKMLLEIFNQVLLENFSYHRNIKTIIYTGKHRDENAVNVTFDILWEIIGICEHNSLEIYYSDKYKQDNYNCPLCNQKTLVSTSFNIPQENDICICKHCRETFIAKTSNGVINFEKINSKSIWEQAE